MEVTRFLHWHWRERALLTAEDKKPSPPPPEKLPPQPPLVQDLVKDLDEHMTIVNDTDKVVETTGDKNTQPKDKPKEKSPVSFFYAIFTIFAT